MRLPEVGVIGQERLRKAKVLVVGVGGLGSPVAMQLVSAGVGKVGLIDPDIVDLSNLHRQPLYASRDVGRPKVMAARERLVEMNPDVEIEAMHAELVRENAERIVSDYDLVCDGTDRFEARYAVNDACVAKRKVNVYASVYRFQGQVTVFVPGGPCYRCLFPQAPEPGSAPTCAEIGVMGSLTGLIGSLQASEALKILLGAGDPLVGRLLIYDGLAGTTETIRYDKDRNCPKCGTSVPTLQDSEMTPGPLKRACGRASSPVTRRSRAV
jgi:sulfur-carrier protein adenylyltransferase/sulfurtransferase